MEFPEVSLFVQQRGEAPLEVEGENVEIYDGNEFVPFSELVTLKELDEQTMKMSLLSNKKVCVLYHEDCRFSLLRGSWVSLKDEPTDFQNDLTMDLIL